MVDGMRANKVSLTYSSTSPGEEASKVFETACNIPQVVDITSAAGTPLPVASPRLLLGDPPKEYGSRRSLLLRP
jgi:hypothetical protein